MNTLATLRRVWTFLYTGAALAAAAASQRDYRLSRLETWTAEKAKILAQIKETGLEITEADMLQLSNSYAHSGRRGTTIQVNEALQEQFQTATAKVAEHEAAAKEYEGWVQTLIANPTAELELTQDDWLFFFRTN